MTDQEIVQALRCCADHSCSAKCPAFPAGLDCREEMHKEVLALIERLTAENAALREAHLQKDKIQKLYKAKLSEFENERNAAIADLADIRSCRVCKHVCDTRDCSSCKAETCKCRNCSLDKHAWEWRGLQSVPEWVSVEDRLPEPETDVLIVCNRNGYVFVTPAIYEDGKMLTQESAWNWSEIYGYGLYSEEDDDYYIPEGWWENRQFNPDDVYNNPVDCTVTHWMPLPKPPEEPHD